MQVTVLPSKLVFEGVLMEETQLSDLLEAFKKVRALGFTPPLTLDFAKVSRANSAGVVTWLKFLGEVKTALKYVNAPVWLVRQFNMIKGYFDFGSYVESFQAPVFSPQGQSSKIVTLTLGKDIPLQAQYVNFQFTKITIDGKVYEADFDPEQYLSFICENYDFFKRAIK